MVQVQDHKPDYAYFMFVNPKSGGNRASIFLELESEKIVFFLDKNVKTGARKQGQKQFEGKTEIEIYFYDMFEEKARERGLTTLKRDQMRGVNVRVIVGGGDGTVMWVVKEMQKAKIDMKNCPIGIVPFGTGNDFARVTGWGSDSPDNVLGSNLRNIKQLAKFWTQACVEDFDIWDIKIATHEDGFFQVIQKNKDNFTKILLKHKKNQNENLKIFKKRMSNYFSFGVDARIGYGFDKSRTTSAFGNKCVYCCEGFKKMFLSTPQVSSTLESMEVIEDDSIDMKDKEKIPICLKEYKTHGTLFTTNSQPNSPEQKGPLLRGNPVNLLCINIPSYSGGASDIWRECQGKVALFETQKRLHDTFLPQYFGDGKIEVVCFQSILGLANERIIKGMAERVAQGNGPYLFKFKEQTIKNQPIKQYIQIDGEYLMVSKPRYIKIRLCKKLPGGKIQVLVNKEFRDKHRVLKQNAQ